MEFRKADWFTITGRGRIAAVTIEDGLDVNIGDHVRIDGDLYEVCGIEQARILTDPPIMNTHVGLWVRPTKPEDL